MRFFIFKTLLSIKSKLSSTGFKSIPKIGAFSRFLLNIIGPKEISIITHQGDTMYVDATDVGIVPDLLSGGVYEPFETQLLEKLLKPGMVVANIGANIGYYTLIASRAVGKNGSVYAFEPGPENFRLLKKNIDANNCTNVIPLQVAVSNSLGTAELFLDKTNIGNPSLATQNIKETGGSVTVFTDTLDSLIEKHHGNTHVDFIQMDVQGAEGLVFEGATKVLTNEGLIIITEFWPYGLEHINTDPHKFLKQLERYGFSIQLIDEYHMTVGPITSHDDIIRMCKEKKDGRGAINILLQRHRTTS